MLIYDFTNIITLIFIFSIVIYIIFALFKDFTRTKLIKINNKLGYIIIKDKYKNKIFIYNSDTDFKKIKNIPKWLQNEILKMNLSDEILNELNKNKIIVDYNEYVLYVENLEFKQKNERIDDNEKENENRNIKYIIFNIDIAEFIDYIINRITIMN